MDISQAQASGYDYPRPNDATREVNPMLVAIRESMQGPRGQLEVLNALEFFTQTFCNNVDHLTVTQKRFITRTLNKLHSNED
jgi:hypothetical protein